MNENSVRAVNSSIFSSRFRRPCYSSYCFAGIPGLIAELLGVAPLRKGLPRDVLGSLPVQAKHVAVIFLDALGWSSFEERVESSPFVGELASKGVLSKLTSQFPSTTSAHVTTLATGLTVEEHAVYEWNMYEPTIGAIIRSLPFSLVNEDGRDTLLAKGFSPEMFFPTPTLSEYLKEAGISVNIYQDRSIALSSYSSAAYKTAHGFPYRNLEDGLRNMADNIKNTQSKSYSLLYYDKIDAASHHHGPKSTTVSSVINGTLNTLESCLKKFFFDKVSDCYLLIVSDHGQTAIDPDKTTYLNRKVPKLNEWILKDKDNNPLVPAGGPRDFFLHLQEESKHEAQSLLREALQGLGEVYLTEDLMKEGLFGNTGNLEALRARAGNLVALPYEGETFWWEGMKRSILRDKGFHGGLTFDEMDIPFIVYPLD